MCVGRAGGEWPQAESHFELFIRKSKGTYPMAQLRYAECLDRQGRFTDALEQLMPLKNQRYALKRLNQCLGRVQLELNNHKAAQEELVVRTVTCVTCGTSETCVAPCSEVLTNVTVAALEGRSGS